MMASLGMEGRGHGTAPVPVRCYRGWHQHPQGDTAKGLCPRWGRGWQELWGRTQDGLGWESERWGTLQTGKRSDIRTGATQARLGQPLSTFLGCSYPIWKSSPGPRRPALRCSGQTPAGGTQGKENAQENAWHQAGSKRTVLPAAPFSLPGLSPSSLPARRQPLLPQRLPALPCWPSRQGSEHFFWRSSAFPSQVLSASSTKE